MIIDELHTSTLTNRCAMSAALALQGLTNKIVETALFRGQLAHEIMDFVHRYGVWDASEINFPNLLQKTCDKFEREGRKLEPVVLRDMQKNLEEVAKLCTHYMARRKDYFAQCTILGVEAPMRWVMEVGSHAPIKMATHCDLIYRDPNGEITVGDYKLNEDWFTMAGGQIDELAGCSKNGEPKAIKLADQLPTIDYLGRNPQFAMMSLMVNYGAVHLNVGGRDEWVEFDENPWLEWVNLNSFKPYSAACKVREFGGGLREYKKGDERPMSVLIRRWRDSMEKQNLAKSHIAKRVLVFEHDLYTPNPDKLGCFLCASKEWCDSYITDWKDQIDPVCEPV